MSPYVTSQSIKIVWNSTAHCLVHTHMVGVPSVPLPDICRGLGRGVGSQQPREQKSLREASCWGPDWTLISCAAAHSKPIRETLSDSVGFCSRFSIRKGAGEFLPEESFFDPSCFSSYVQLMILKCMAPYGSFGGRGSKQDLKARWVLMPLSRNQTLDS